MDVDVSPDNVEMGGMSVSPFQADKQRSTDYCKLYREGRATEWNIEKRRPIFELLKLPKSGKWPGLNRVGRANANPRTVDLGVMTARHDAATGFVGTKENARAAATRITPQVQPYGLTFKKLLGWGGLGVASLFELKDKNDNTRRQVVVKSDLHMYQALVGEEKRNFSYLSRASHIVQMVRLRLYESHSAGSKRKAGQPGHLDDENPEQTKRRRLSTSSAAGTPASKPFPITTLNVVPSMLPRKILQPIPRIKKPVASALASGLTRSIRMVENTLSPSSPEPQPSSTRPPPARSSATSLAVSGDAFPEPSKPPPEISGNDNVLVLELASRGDLLKWMNKMASSKKKFSNKVLWRFFECLFKGVVAMAFPPRTYDDFVSTGAEDGPVEDERIPDKLDDLGRNLVHFDLDPSNVLVGDFNIDNKHGMTPILKIADFGLSKMITDIQHDSAAMWSLRVFGKCNNGYLAPEQFTSQWDWVDGAPASEPTKPSIAGNFSWKTNLYHVGMIMWSLVTLTHPPSGPFPSQIRSTKIDKKGRPILKWTYGGYLMEPHFDYVDKRLRLLIMELMMDDPADRPRIEVIARTVRSKVDGPWPGESDEQTREWAREFFETPGTAGPAQPTPEDVKLEEVIAALQGAGVD